LVLTLGWLSILYDFFCLLQKGRGKKYDLIHCNVEHLAVTARLLSMVWRIPYTVTAHGTYGVVLPQKMKAFRYAFEHAAGVICVSRFTEQRIKAAGVSARTVVIHNGVDTTCFRPDPSVPKERLITFVGNLKRRKGFPFLVDALIQAKASGATFRLAVVGRVGNDSAGHLQRAKDAGLDILLTGPVTMDELVGYYQRARLNILPSLSEPDYFEGFGLIHLEANACGTLTVGTLDSGNVEAVMEGNGWLVEYGDVDALARIVLEAMREPDVERLAPATLALRDWADVANSYLQVFRQVQKKAG